MPTDKQIATQLKKEQAQIKRDIVSRITTATMTILHDSYLFGSSIWPKDGFRPGDGTSIHNKECIFVGVNAYGITKTPLIGRLHLHPNTPKQGRYKSQKKHIKFILDYAIKDSITFEDEFRNTDWFDTELWFTFKIEE